MKILVVDDDFGSCLVARAAVEALGHECITAADGDAAWEMLSNDKPDVLISDRNMPGLDGTALCQAIRASDLGNYTYVILLTTRDDQSDVLSGMRAGADDYLSKPLDPFRLEARLLAAERVTSLHAELSRYRNDLRAQARTDPLTQVRNRLHLTEELSGLHRHSSRYGHDYSVAMIDIDCFKGYNDAFGHQAGDAALISVAGVLRASLRDHDEIYRYGGEEFLLVLPEQSAGEARMVVERLRAGVQALGIAHPTTGPGVLTISAGVACCTPRSTVSTVRLIEAADVAMYEAKEAGRNTVVQSADDGAGPSGSEPPGERAPVGLALAEEGVPSLDGLV
ncbi:MAG: diguanylate cyclase [Mycobacteriales bacterium]